MVDGVGVSESDATLERVVEGFPEELDIGVKVGCVLGRKIDGDIIDGIDMLVGGELRKLVVIPLGMSFGVDMLISISQG